MIALSTGALIVTDPPDAKRSSWTSSVTTTSEPLYVARACTGHGVRNRIRMSANNAIFIDITVHCSDDECFGSKPGDPVSPEKNVITNSKV
jgi:hypothetical protein